MPGLGNTEQNIVLDQLTTGGAADPPATRYWGLRLNGVEKTGAGYDRVEMTSATAWATATDAWLGSTNARVNAGPIEFPNPAAAWGFANELALYNDNVTATPAAVFDLESDTGGSLYIEENVPVTILPGEVVFYYYDGLGLGSP